MDNRTGFLDAQQLALADPCLIRLRNASMGESDVKRFKRVRLLVRGRASNSAFDPTFATRLALREKQIQQNYRPIIGIHKWFARQPSGVSSMFG